MKGGKRDKRRSPFFRLRWGGLLPILQSAVFGALLLSFGEENRLCVAMGIFFALFGGIFLLGAFLGGRAEFIQIAFGAVYFALAVLFFADRKAASFLSVLSGVLLFVRAVFGVVGAISRRESAFSKIQLTGVLLLAVFSVVLFFGVIGSFRILRILLGVVFLFEALMELLSWGFSLQKRSDKKDSKKHSFEKKE